MYDIRLATSSEGDALAQFIDQHWKAGHVFAVNRELLDWQHLDNERGVYNFVIGVHAETGEIHGILGFIPLSKFDAALDPARLVWMAIWKVRDEARGHRLGRRLMDYLEDTVKPEIISTVAASAMTLPMYQAKGYQTGQLKQYFILNSETSVYLMVDTAGFQNHPQPVVPGRTLVPMSEQQVLADSSEVFASQTDLPIKSPFYFSNRYFRHPFYKYETLGIFDDGSLLAIFVIRVCPHDQANALRVVDFAGPSFALNGLAEEWQRLLREKKAEYVDFCCAGIDDVDLRASGFSLRQNIDGLVMPHYFEPFYKKNVEIDYMISLPVGTPHRVVKGDSDQDRPNVLDESA